LPAHNARYNIAAENLQKLPFEANTFDLVFLNSVFSHMMTKDVLFYLNEFKRTLKPNGILYVTAFVEENVPEVEENPENYLGESKGYLHRVRFEKQFFTDLFVKTGFTIKVFTHQHITRTKQSVIIANLLPY
jgi:ubiquinone/menaquinone biosynthesis C-methylase UbiE